MSEDDKPDDAELGGTVLLEDDAPRVAADGTILIGPSEEDSSFERRSSRPPPIPDAGDTSVPPEIDPTPPPSDFTLDKSEAGDAPPETLVTPAPPELTFEESAVDDARPEPPAAAPPPRAEKAPPAPAPPRPANKLPLWAQLLALVVVAGVVGHLVARMQSGDERPAATQAPAPKPPAPKPTSTPAPEPAPAPRPSAAPAPPPPAPVAAADLSSCVSKHLFGLTFPSDKLTFVCEDADANHAQRDMSTLVATGEDVDRDGRGEWQKLAWYRMAKLQIVRSRCCGDAEALDITAALSACGLGESLAALQEADRTAGSMAEPVAAYHKAVDCLFKANTMRRFGILARPDEFQRDTFVKSLSP